MQDKPTTHQGNLAKLPQPLAPLIARPQWAVWRWTLQKNGKWQKPPFMATKPDRHASTSDPATWSDYATALAAVQAGNADGITYILTASDPFIAMDLDHCRNPNNSSIDIWAQNFLDTTRNSYAEVTPSGDGIRIWGLTAEATAPINRKFTFEIDDKPIAAELFRHTHKALTITGYRLDSVKALANIDRALDWAIVWGERRKAIAAEAAAAAQSNGHEFNALGGRGHDIEYIDKMVREGALNGGNRSDNFHVVVGHYLGCDWGVEQIYQHIQQFPDGIGAKYIGEGRLRGEIERSARKFDERRLPLSDGWTAPEPAIEVRSPSLEPDDAELEDDPDLDNQAPEPTPAPKPEPASKPKPLPKPKPDPEDDDPPELEDDLVEDDPDDDPPEDEDQSLPPSYGHGDPNPFKREWLIKHIMTTVGHGVLAGPWGAGKTFIGIDLAIAVVSGQPFLGHLIKRQCGVMWIAAEGANEVCLRIDEALRDKFGSAERIPLRWYAETPKLLGKGTTKKLISMARRENERLQAEFGLPLGLIVIDTVTACAGYPQAGGEYDSATSQALMDVLKEVSKALGCFVLGVRHVGKNADAGVRGSVVTEDAADLILMCMGERSLSGVFSRTRLAVRKNKGGPQGEEHSFTLRKVEAPEPDEDGDPVTTMVVDWKTAGGSAPGTAEPPPDPWAAARRQDQRTVALRLRRALMNTMAEHGVELPVPPDGPIVRMVDLPTVREEFFRHTPAEGEAKQQRNKRSQQFTRALEWVEQKQLIAIEQIDEVTYLRLTRPDPDLADDEEG